MKSIIKSSLLLCAGVALFSACDKDLDHNPTLQTPKTFKLNTPTYAAQNNNDDFIIDFILIII